MPRISAFYGIVIVMYRNDHWPPHFHALYGEYEARVDLRRLVVLSGRLPPRSRRLVLRWARLHQVALLANWVRAERGAALVPIEPLP